MSYDKYDRILGCLLGAAIGDAMGCPLETRTVDMIKRDYGNGDFVYDYRLPLHDSLAHELPRGLVTDDFSCAYMAANEYLADGGVVTSRGSERAMLKWCESELTRVFYERYVGPSTKEGLINLKNGDKNKINGNMLCSPLKATNGASMKGWIIGAFHPGELDKAIDDTIVMCLVTHNNDGALCAATAASAAVSCAILPDSTLADVVEAGLYGAREGYKRSRKVAKRCASASIEKRIGLAVSIGMAYSGDFEKCIRTMTDVIGTGLPANESVPAAFGYLVASGGDVMRSIYHCINSGNDCDSTAIVAGAISGALMGARTIPDEHLPFLESVNSMDISGLAQRINKLSD